MTRYFIFLILCLVVSACDFSNRGYTNIPCANYRVQKPIGVRTDLTFESLPETHFESTTDENYRITQLEEDRVTAASSALQFTNSVADWASNIFTSGSVQSLFYYGYGTFTMRLKASEMPGVVSAFHWYNETAPLSEGGVRDEIAILFSGNMHPGKVMLQTYRCAGSSVQVDVGENQHASELVDLRVLLDNAYIDVTDYHNWVLTYALSEVTLSYDGTQIARITRGIPEGTRLKMRWATFHDNAWPSFIVTPPTGTGSASIVSYSFLPQ